MSRIEDSFEIEDQETLQYTISDITLELNSKLIDMGEISSLDKRAVAVVDSIRSKLDRKVVADWSGENLSKEIPRELLQEYVTVMFIVEQDAMLKRSDYGQNAEEDLAFKKRYEQAKVLGLKVNVDPNISYVLDLPQLGEIESGGTEITEEEAKLIAQAAEKIMGQNGPREAAQLLVGHPNCTGPFWAMLDKLYSSMEDKLAAAHAYNNFVGELLDLNEQE